MRTNQVEFASVRHWLERKVRARVAANLTIALTHVVLGLMLLVGTAWFAAWVLLAGFGRVVEIARHNFGVPLRYQESERGLLVLAAVMLVLLVAGNARSGAVNLGQFGQFNWRSRAGTFAALAALGAMFSRVLYLGPSLLVQAVGFFQKWSRWKNLDREIIAEVLHLLAGESHRVAYEEIARRIRGFSHSRTVPQLHLIDGILFLTAPPGGLALTSELREELSGRGVHRETGAGAHEFRDNRRTHADAANRARGRRVVFLCGGCQLKLRVLIASENISIKCPRCRAVYRVCGIEGGRIQMQRVSSGFRQRKPPPPPPPPPPRAPFDHELLGVKRDATAEEIKHAYRSLLKANHPDFFANAAPEERARAEEYTKQLNQAYRSMMLRFDK